MAFVFDPSVGGTASNSYPTISDADDYFAGRVPLSPPWDEYGDKEAALVMATRLLDSLFRGVKTLVVDAKGNSFYRIGRKWLGAPATSTQHLAFPRVGLLHDNGSPVLGTEIPWELKDATSEFAGQLTLSDRSLDFDVATQGITSVKAGSVAVTFRDGYIATFVLPQAVLDLIPPSWYTEETIESTSNFDFEVMTP